MKLEMNKKEKSFYLTTGGFVVLMLVVAFIDFAFIQNNENNEIRLGNQINEALLNSENYKSNYTCLIDRDCNFFGANSFCIHEFCSSYGENEDREVDNNFEITQLNSLGFFADFLVGQVINSIRKDIYYTDGFVGVNTATPQNALNVVGDLNVTERAYFDRVNIFSNLTLGSPNISSNFFQNYNNIVAPGPGQRANIAKGINLINSAPASSGASQNSPAISFTAQSWNPDVSASQFQTWSIHNWGFNTPGTTGGVLTFTVERPTPINILTLSPVAIDEAGRVLLGYTKQRSANYYGFAGEDFGQWNVILAGKTVVGWPENGITSDLLVTGNTEISKNLIVSGVDLLYENEMLKKELCQKDNTYSWC